MHFPLSAPTSCQSWQLSLWAAYVIDSSATMLLPFDEYTTSHISPFSPIHSHQEPVHVASQTDCESRQSSQAQWCSFPKRNACCGGCWEIGCLRGDARGPLVLPAISCAKTKCQHAGWARVPALYFREFETFLCRCAQIHRQIFHHKVIVELLLNYVVYLVHKCSVDLDKYSQCSEKSKIR